MHARDNISDMVNIYHWFYRKVESGSYIITPLGMKLLDRIVDTIHEEFSDWGNIILPTLQKEDSWKNRIEQVKDIIFRTDNGLLLAPTNEIYAFKYLQSDKYSTLRKIYQIHWKYRKEARYNQNMYRTREFLMFDGYSIGTLEQVEKHFNEAKAKIFNIFSKLNIKVDITNSDPTAMGAEGSSSVEFQADGKELAEIFFLNKTYTEGDIVTGSYGIGITRILDYMVQQVIKNGSLPISIFDYATLDIKKYCHRTSLYINFTSPSMVEGIVAVLNIKDIR